MNDKVVKCDMLKFNDVQLEYVNMGLFDSDKEWIHPTVTVNTYEIIYVVEGEIHIREGEQRYDLVKGDMLLLEPGIEHGGTAVSLGRTSFYWLHYHCTHHEALELPKRSAPDEVTALRTMNELMHLQQANPTVAELALARFLLECGRVAEYGNKRLAEIVEYIRANSREPLSVVDVAARYGYSADHLSRMFKKEFGYDAKTAIVKKRLEYIESRLLNSEYSIKEIAAQCGFEDENSFVKFFKYHTKTTPTLFRNRYFHVHLNSK
ncbi:MAG: helix-turn-helix domain-containing protein [Ruminococcaceae bacterium]|nr:helix-turn-helix domain-containing protein [Oscillospiraceae bacterium]